MRISGGGVNPHGHGAGMETPGRQWRLRDGAAKPAWNPGEGCVKRHGAWFEDILSTVPGQTVPKTKGAWLACMRAVVFFDDIQVTAKCSVRGPLVARPYRNLQRYLNGFV